MGWVEDRLEREHIIADAADDLWSDVCSAFEEAVKSVKRNVSNIPAEVEYSRLSENKFIVRVHLPNRIKKEVALTYNPESKEITVGVGIKKNMHRVTFEVEGGRAVLMLDKEQVTPDELSRRVLEPVLFGK